MSERVEVPWRELSGDALQGLLEEMVSRDGTDYGERELSLEEKVAQLHEALRRGRVRIVFNTATESCSIESVEP